MATDVSNEKLTIPVKEKPTFWNDGIYSGIFWGGAIASTLAVGAAALGGFPEIPALGGSAQLANVSLPIYSAAVAGSAAGSLVGGVIGGIKRKKTMEHENQFGREVKEPSFWNKNIAVGLGAAQVLGTVALATGLVMSSIGIVSVASAMMVGGAILGVSQILGFFNGGLEGKDQMKKDYDFALALKEQSKGITQVRDREAGIIIDQPQQGYSMAQYRNSVTPEESHALNMRMRQGDPATAAFAHQVEAARAVAVEQTNVKG